MAMTTISRPAAEAVALEVLKAVGVPEVHASITARSLVLADLRGVTTHGLVRLPVYVEQIRSGDIVSTASPEIVRRDVATALVDGHHGLGQINAEFAMRLAIEIAHEAGVGTVAVRHSGHLGAAAGYAIMAADEGFIGLCTTNTAPLLPPVGGNQRRVGNNPLAIAAPSNEGFPVALDIAMSAVAGWRIQMAADRGESIPPEWAFGKDGEPTTDAEEAFRGGGLLRPMGDHKGFGLALMMDVLAGILSGGAFGTQVKGLLKPGALDTSHFLLAIDISRFTELEAFRERVGEMAKEIHDTPTKEGVEGSLLPGEMEARKQKEQEQCGISYAPEVYDPLVELARSLDLDMASIVDASASRGV